MNRRRFLATASVGGLAASAGCLDELRRWGGSAGPRPTGTDDARVSLPVSQSDLHRGAAKDGIPAITVPAFAADWSSTDATLSDEERVVGVAAGGETRAYPLSVLIWHGVVNDVFEPRSTSGRNPPGTPFSGSLLVAYCPLSGSAVVADRRAADVVRTFGVSGLLWQSSLVLYDVESDSLWSHLLAMAVCGSLAGTHLTCYPSTTTTWGEWKRAHPATTVLLPPPASDTVKGWQTRDYDLDPYVGYDLSERVGVGDQRTVDGRLHPKAVVVGVPTDGGTRAYPLDTVDRAAVVNDFVGDRPVVVAATRSGSLVAYDRRIGDAVFAFERDGDVLVGGGSRWDLLTGTALDGPYAGTRLVRASDRSPMYWFAWTSIHPNTDLFG